MAAPVSACDCRLLFQHLLVSRRRITIDFCTSFWAKIIHVAPLTRRCGKGAGHRTARTPAIAPAKAQNEEILQVHERLTTAIRRRPWTFLIEGMPGVADQTRFKTLHTKPGAGDGLSYSSFWSSCRNALRVLWRTRSE